MPAAITPVDPSDHAALDAIVQLVATEQRDPTRTVIYVGDEAVGIRAELDALDPPWTATVRVLRDEAGQLLGVALAEWDAEVGRAWLYGPWIAADDASWATWSHPLLDAVEQLVPDGIDGREVSGTVANTRLAGLAAELGWPPSEANHVYVLDAATVAGWPADDAAVAVRPMAPGDIDAIAPLHDAEFPATYHSAAQLVARAERGESTALVAVTTDGGVAGYAAGQVQPDGEGYIDFVAVDPATRGAGVGRALVVGLARRLLAASTKGQVALTVQAHRTPARALYEALGFRCDVAFVGYRRPEG